MTRDELVGIKIGTAIYNTRTKAVCVMSSQWSSDKGPVKDDEYLSCDMYDGTYGPSIRMGDYEEWEYLTDYAPDSVMIQVLKVRLLKLEAFVMQRLR